jgi:hypothetical protein
LLCNEFLIHREFSGHGSQKDFLRIGRSAIAEFSHFVVHKEYHNQQVQRLGDIVAGTCVIRTQNRYTLKLEQLEKIYSAEGYVAEYPAVIHCTEEEMLLVKEVLYRSNRFRNKAHSAALDKAAQNICRRLEINSPPSDKRLFLKKVLQDYVALSR